MEDASFIKNIYILLVSIHLADTARDNIIDKPTDEIFNYIFFVVNGILWTRYKIIIDF